MKKLKIKQLFENYKDNQRIMTNLRMLELPKWQIDYENLQNQNYEIRDKIIRIDPLFFDKIKQEKEEKIKKEKDDLKLTNEIKALEIKGKILINFGQELKILKTEICELNTLTKINKKIDEIKLKIRTKFPKIGLQFTKTGEFVGVIL